MASRPTKAFLFFSASFTICGSSALLWTQRMPSSVPLELTRIMPTTSSFTAFELPPGVLNTTMPCLAQRSMGMLL